MCGVKGQEDQVTRTKGPVMAPCAAVGMQQGECVLGRALAVFGLVFEAPAEVRQVREWRLQD